MPLLLKDCETDSLPVLWYLLPFIRLSFVIHSFIPLLAPQSSQSIIQGRYIRQINGRISNIPASYINKKVLCILTSPSIPHCEVPRPSRSCTSFANVINSIHLRYEVSTAGTMKNVDFWDIKTKSVLHRRHITSPLQSPAG
jgi:hypothetical protein